MENYDTKNALRDLDKIRDDWGDEIPQESGWIIIDEDDDLIEQWDDVELRESLSADAWSNISPCDIIYCSANIQHEGEYTKRRPMLNVYKTGTPDSPVVIGMQITSKGPGNGFRNKFRSELKDWKEIGLLEPSWINYDHFVKNIDDNIKTPGNSITKRDAISLLNNIKTNYDDLIRLGYANPKDKELLDKFIKYLEYLY